MSSYYGGFTTLLYEVEIQLYREKLKYKSLNMSGRYNEKVLMWQ